MFREFKDFIRRGSVIDLAVGFVMGAAFGKVATSFINDVVMPPIGLLLGNIDFANFYINLSGRTFESLAQAREAGAPVIAYGAFVSAVVDFLVVALAVFIVIRWINKLKSKPAPAAPTTKECPFCLSIVPLKAVRCPHCTSELK
jgi:large conductance mechanosensitive channel